MAKHDSIVGDLINFRGLVYSPINEQGVVFLFGKVAADLNMYVEEIKPGFPDCIARRFTGRGWDRVRVEFEFESKNFLQHKHNHEDADLVICWDHNWPNCPLEVIELREVIKGLPNPPIQRPDQQKSADQGQPNLEDFFAKRKASSRVREWARMLVDGIRQLSDETYVKVGEKTITIYSPERVFIYVKPRQKTLGLTIFTRGEELANVMQIDIAHGGEKWGRFIVRTEADAANALVAAKESLERIKRATKENETTGWYATVEDDSDDDTDAKV